MKEYKNITVVWPHILPGYINPLAPKFTYSWCTTWWRVNQMSTEVFTQEYVKQAASH